MTDIEKMREEFEISFVAQTACMLPEGEDVSRKDFAAILLDAMADDRKGNSYGTDLYKVGWWAWQASRQAVVVELPPAFPGPASFGGDVMSAFSVRDEVTRLGLRVKS